MVKKFGLFLLFLIATGSPISLGLPPSQPETKYEYYRGGAVKKEQTLISDKKDEVRVREYYPKGQLKKEFTLRADNVDGLAKAYYESGALKAEAYYQNGKWHGLSKMYYETGGVWVEADFREGDGIEKEYDPSGRLRAETPYRNQRPHGARKEYDERGVLLYEDILVRGERIRRKKFTEGGKLVFDQRYRGNWFQEALAYLWNNLNENLPPFVTREYDDEGGLKKETIFWMERDHKIVKTYYPNGLLQYEDAYQKGELMRRKKYNQEGRLEFDEDGRRGSFQRVLGALREKKIVKTEAGGGGGSQSIPLVNIEK
jgi:antitoxin component YwqK of YwqJK toxin-antitoxin module